jgi:hypothetical protein
MIARTSKAAGFIRKNGKSKFSVHSLRRLFYNSLTGLDDVDREALMGHVKGVRARYHGTVDELRKAVEFMRQKYEFGMRHLISGGTPEEQRKQMLLDYARMQGLSDEKITKIQEALGSACTVEQLRDAIQSEIDIRPRPTMTNGGKAYNAKLVNENTLCQYIETGWEIIKELSNGKVAIRKAAN